MRRRYQGYYNEGQRIKLEEKGENKELLYNKNVKLK